ncbi:MAG TPA: flagellin [Bacteriovoracaceae bacterium]|nr:flagellin [Bacteriovoracaceae bacterium]
MYIYGGRVTDWHNRKFAGIHVRANFTEKTRMGFRVNTNIAAIQSQTALKKAGREIDESSTKMSSGEKITKAADDAAGLAISEKIKSEVRSSRQANRNANDGVSLIQVAEGGLNESSSILTRMRELAIQAATDTMDDVNRANSNGEYQAMKAELERIAQVTEFNGRKLLNGSSEKLTFQVGTGDNSSDDHVGVDPGQINATTQSLGVTGASINSKESARMGLGKLDSAINKISGYRSILGSIQNRLVSSSNNLSVYTENMAAANSRIRDTDYATESGNHAKGSILREAGTAVMAQANTSGNVALKLL